MCGTVSDEAAEKETESESMKEEILLCSTITLWFVQSLRQEIFSGSERALERFLASRIRCSEAQGFLILRPRAKGGLVQVTDVNSFPPQDSSTRLHKDKNHSSSYLAMYRRAFW